MIAIIRITGKVKIRKEIEETLHRLRIRRKYACVVIDEDNKDIMGMLKKVRDYVAYGKINAETLKELKAKRGKKGKAFFRLHPPRKGIKSKEHFPRGVLGDHGDKINELIKRML